MRLHRIPKAVNVFYGRIAGGIIPNGIAGTGDIIIDRTGDAYHGDPVPGQIMQAPKGTVSADPYNTIQPQQLTGIHRFLHPKLCPKLITAGRIQHRSTQPADTADTVVVQYLGISIDKAVKSSSNTHTFNSKVYTGPDHRPDSSIHTGSVPAACQDPNPANCVFHVAILLFLHCQSGILLLQSHRISLQNRFNFSV